MRQAKLIFLFTLCFVSSQIYGQIQIGYVDSDTIMKQIPDYQDTQQRLDAIIQEWNEEIRKQEADMKKMEDEYEKRKLILTEPKRIEMEKEIIQLEQEITKFRQQKFGVNGELFKKQEELMKPLQNLIFNAIQEVAEEEELDFVFDRSGDILFLYAKEEYDITNLVLDKLR
ncbi:MAG: OmpH family outer membrane protein [Melioribacteraceae bacterium]|nr:OmpH family outer membrane protein [Melioribacteraceae bacterium]MCF8264055.1 OmpH family outer membrane protein [Melioribacteraceae bacterium]MCF8411867.1 OmpH family outer membrane protein [Melioribacteraceae bacterium]